MDYLEKHPINNPLGNDGVGECAMSYLKKYPINNDWITKEITVEAVRYADEFANYLATEDTRVEIKVEWKDGRKIEKEETKKVNVALTTSQLRKFFGAVKSLQIAGITQSKADLVMLKPKLAYAEGRVKQKNGNIPLKITDFREVVTKAIDIVVNSKDMERSFKNFVNFFEAIVAYHKVYGKDK